MINLNSQTTVLQPIFLLSFKHLTGLCVQHCSYKILYKGDCLVIVSILRKKKSYEFVYSSEDWSKEENDYNKDV